LAPQWKVGMEFGLLWTGSSNGIGAFSDRASEPFAMLTHTSLLCVCVCVCVCGGGYSAEAAEIITACVDFYHKIDLFTFALYSLFLDS
jgi:hypothetical protein